MVGDQTPTPPRTSSTPGRLPSYFTTWRTSQTHDLAARQPPALPPPPPPPPPSPSSPLPPLPHTNEGLSFKPVLESRQSTIRDVLYGVYNGGTKPGMRSLKKGDWKLVQYDVHDGRVRQNQLFNLADNPHEFLAKHHDPQVIARTGVVPGTASSQPC